MNLIRTVWLSRWPHYHGMHHVIYIGLVLAMITVVNGSLATAQPARKLPVGGRNPDTAPAATGPKDYSSRNFLVHTDISKDEAEALLNHLETMLDLISKYWGRRNRQTIEMYVIKDLENWPNKDQLAPEGVRSIANGGGLTLHGSHAIIGAGGEKQIVETKAIVYASARHGTPEHEAVHAYCALNFGRTGPVWYAEGMAEMGQYWKDKDYSVNCSQEVVEYLTSSQRKELIEIVDPNQKTGDSWQNYAWRWALCHLLSYNVNYRDRFRPLGISLLTDQPTSFEKVYGNMDREIEFEYAFFVKNLTRGFRVDLCSWDWKTKFSQPRVGRGTTAAIFAQRGWQASRAQLVEGMTYRYKTKGKWKLDPKEEELTADGTGAPDSAGRLEAVIMKDYTLGEPFSLGVEGTFSASDSGKLFLRCRDGWADIGNNSGSITVTVDLVSNP